MYSYELTLIAADIRVIEIASKKDMAHFVLRTYLASLLRDAQQTKKD